MSLTTKLTIGTQIQYNGEIWRIVGIETGAINLRSQHGHAAVLELSALVGKEDFKVLRLPDTDAASSAATFPESVSEAVIAGAEKLLEHLNEAECGYRSGNSATARSDEPRYEYDPDGSTLNQRMKVKSIETGISVRTLWELKKAYKESGIFGLVDKRLIKESHKSTDPRILEAISHVQVNLITGSNITKMLFGRRVTKYLTTRYPEEEIALPSRPTFNKLLDRVAKGKSLFGSAKQRRNISNQPKQTYRKFYATRPGEMVLIDSTPLDAFALDPVTFKWIQIQLTIALDLFTGSLIAWRFTPVSTKAVDAALLLYDIIRPKLMQPGWPQAARWSYMGVPEYIVIEIRPEASELGVAGVPVLHPETVVIDHGKVFISSAFRDACTRLGTNIQLARPYTPTDKAHVERVFRTIREQFVEALPGYKGPDVYSRGLDVEGDAFYFLDEIDAKFAEWVVTYYQRKHHEGLSLPGLPHINMSPNDMYNEGIVRAGFVHVVTDQTMYYELLPTEWRTVQHYGVETNGVRYDGEILDEFRNQKSHYGGLYAGKWPIRYDPRDLSRVFFYDPEFRTWHTLAWTHSAGEDRPFNEATLGHAKALVLAREGNPNNVNELADTLNDLLDRIETPSPAARKERRLAAINAMHGLLAKEDRPKSQAQYSPPDAEAEMMRDIPNRPTRKNDIVIETDDQSDPPPLRTVDEAMEDDEDDLDF